MKLLYIWIEEFRGILHQGIVIDNEYVISVENPEISTLYHDINGQQAALPSSWSAYFERKIYLRRIKWAKAPSYSSTPASDPIRSIAILARKNAVGKSNILKCLCEQNRGNFSADPRAYFLVFLNERNHCIEIRSQDIRIIGENILLQKLPHHKDYEHYIIPLDSFANSSAADVSTRFFFLTSQKGIESYTGYMMMDMMTVMSGLDSCDDRNAFSGAFNFFYHFPKLKDTHNKLVFFLNEHSTKQHLDYFTKPEYSPEEYKTFFIYKLAEVLFSNLRMSLYFQPPEFIYSGWRIASPNEDTLTQEDNHCRELMRFVAGPYPQESPQEKISIQNNAIPHEKINRILEFFENNLSASKTGHYRVYIASIRKLFETLYTADYRLFTAFYKLEIPLEVVIVPLSPLFRTVCNFAYYTLIGQREQISVLNGFLRENSASPCCSPPFTNRWVTAVNT